MSCYLNGNPIDKSVGANARTLATVLHGLKTIYSDNEIIELFKPENVIGGLKILSEEKYKKDTV